MRIFFGICTLSGQGFYGPGVEYLELWHDATLPPIISRLLATCTLWPRDLRPWPLQSNQSHAGQLFRFWESKPPAKDFEDYCILCDFDVAWSFAYSDDSSGWLAIPLN